MKLSLFITHLTLIIFMTRRNIVVMRIDMTAIEMKLSG